MIQEQSGREHGETDFNARHVIEALRSGVPSRAVGEYFSEARLGNARRVQDRLESVRETGRSGGMVFTGVVTERERHTCSIPCSAWRCGKHGGILRFPGQGDPCRQASSAVPQDHCQHLSAGVLPAGLPQEADDLTQGSNVSRNFWPMG